jgi:predicted GTPase
MKNTLKITAMEKNNSKFYPLIWVYKKKSMYDENELEMIQIDTTHNMYRTTLTEDSFFKNYDIVTRNEYGNIEMYIKNIELDGVMIFNIEDYPFLLKE